MVVAVLLVLAVLAAIGAGAWCWVLVRRWRAEQAEVRRVKQTFARYVPRSVVVELLNRKRWNTQVELATAIFEYLEIFHNRQRRHSSLGMLTPIEFEARCGPTTAA